ncbi:MAG: type II secretion system F family protein [Candidatus Dormibacter sp.]|uniref:type II secretion system F family protein n=1 Tax=Candidatus Dormibacter sp. TaxID=2973982 RepID=UPI000DB245F9|nr:MAG: hypothetical protein DLM66_06245 [Candidatus Dormibacteraeota bacterium]
MRSVIFSPLFFFAQIVLILALAAFLAANLAGWSSRRRFSLASNRHLRSYFERERSRALALGWSERTWWALRIGAALAGLAAGVLIGTPVVIIGGILCGTVLVPFLLGPIADQRKVRREHALVEQARNIVDLVRQSNQSLEEALRDAGQNPIPELRSLLLPLADTQLSLRDRLIELDRRAASPIANRICADIMLSLDISPEAFVLQATQVLIPQYMEDLELQDKNLSIAAGARVGSYIVVLIMGVIFLAVMRVDSFREAYATPLGQLVLILIALSVVFIIWLIGQMTPRTRSVRWNLISLKARMESRYA